MIDVNFVRKGTLAISEWAIMDDYTASDHRYIGFTLGSPPSAEIPAQKSHVKRAVRKLDSDVLARKLGEGSVQSIVVETVYQAEKLCTTIWLRSATPACRGEAIDRPDIGQFIDGGKKSPNRERSALRRADFI